MHREADILQQRIEITALDRRIGNANKGIRGDQDEQIERRRDPGLHRQHVRAQRQRQVVAEDSDQSAEQCKDQHPQQHRAFVIAPDAGELVDQRLQGMRILVHVDDGKIRRHVQHHQRAERGNGEDHLGQRGRARDIHQRRITQPRPQDRYHGLDQRQSKREHQGVVAGFCDHFAAPWVLTVLSPTGLSAALLSEALLSADLAP